MRRVNSVKLKAVILGGSAIIHSRQFVIGHQLLGGPVPKRHIN
jgi:hypothetical protein